MDAAGAALHGGLLEAAAAGGEFVDLRVECAALPGKGRGLRAAAELPEAGALLLRAGGLLLPAPPTRADAPLAQLEYGLLIGQLRRLAGSQQPRLGEEGAGARLLRRSLALFPAPVAEADREAFVAKQYGGGAAAGGLTAVQAYTAVLQAELDSADGPAAAGGDGGGGLPPSGLQDGTALLDLLLRSPPSPLTHSCCLADWLVGCSELGPPPMYAGATRCRCCCRCC